MNGKGLIRGIAAACAIFASTVLLTFCENGADGKAALSFLPPGETYQDLPNTNPADISAIKRILNGKKEFTYGAAVTN